jgi:hypothetical protein
MHASPCAFDRFTPTLTRPLTAWVTGLPTLRECYNVIHIQFEMSRNPIGQVFEN